VPTAADDAAADDHHVGAAGLLRVGTNGIDGRRHRFS
jgi:hypothetical protein